MSETFTFTPIPHGAHNSSDPQDGILRCSVHVGVRLMPAAGTGTVAEFDNFVNWPERIPSFAIQIGDGPPQPATFPSALLSADQTVPWANQWSAFFPPALPVRAYRAGTPLPPAATDRWFDAGAVAGQIRTRYTTAAQTAIQPSPGLHFQRTPIRINPGFPVQEKAVIDTALMAARTYFQPPPSESAIRPPAPLLPPPDVHDLLAYMHQTPAILRALRLILEIETPWPGGAPPQTPTTVKLVVPPFPESATIVAPTVVFSLAANQVANGFEPASGLWVCPYDPMHAAHVYSRYVAGALPALRSSGLSMLRRPVAGAVSASMALTRARVARAADLASTPIQPADLNAGHRIDVWDGNHWRSLCKVTGTVGRGGASLAIDAEGIVSSNVVLDADGAVRANDTLAYWNGWSLCAPRPNFKTNPPPVLARAPLGLAVSRSVQHGSLPVLRFGKTYRFRARLVDVAGNSLPPPAGPAMLEPALGPRMQDFIGATDPQTFLRCEPVGSPAMVFSAVPGLGESSTQLVVRTPALAAPSELHVVTGPHSGGIPPDQCLRYVLPPQASVELAEKHGMFDTQAGAPDPAAYARIQQKLQGVGSLWNCAEAQPSNAFPTKAAVFAGQTYPGGPPAVPYLPDPACGGAALIALANGPAIGIENGGATSLSFNTTGAYPDNAQAGMLQLVAGAAGAAGSTVAGQSNSLIITLPPGERVTLGLASTVPLAMTPMLALAQWAHDALEAGAQPPYMANVAAGLAGAVTPRREISLLHAVQQPLSAPAISGAGVQWPNLGDLAGTVVGVVTADLKTTANVTIEASWTEWIDQGPGTAPPAAVAMTAHIATLIVDPASNPPIPALQTRYMFGDTKCRNPLALNAIAASAFAEFFPAGADCTRRAITPAVTYRASSQAPAKPRFAYAIPTFKWTRSEVAVGVPYTSTRRGHALRIWLERPWYTSGNGEVLAVIVGNGPLNSQTQPSQWGADPLTASQAPNGPTICDFLAETDSNFAGTATAVLQDSGETVSLKLYQVEFDAITDRYFCDIAFDASEFAGAYRPFVQLEIAAYQPTAAFPNLALSDTVTVPFTQVFADRSLTVTLVPSDGGSGPYVNITLQGQGPEADSPAFTSQLGRGMSTQVDAVLVFTGVVGPKVFPPLSSGSKTSTSSSNKMEHQVTLPSGKTVWVPNPPVVGNSVVWPSDVGLDLSFSNANGQAVLDGWIAEGVNWGAVVISILEWEMLSPGPQLVVPTGVAPNGQQGYELAGSWSGQRPWRMVYAEKVTMETSFVPPIEPLPKGFEHHNTIT